MKLPNGYGSVYKLPGNRRKPWAVRITTSHLRDADGKTHWKYKYLGYYRTYAEGLNALAHFNENAPCETPFHPAMTFEEVFDEWSREHYPKVSRSNIRGYNAAYSLCGSIKDLPFCSIRKYHLQEVIDHCDKNYPTLKKIKILFTALYKYALENDICSKNYAQYIDIYQYKDKNPNAVKRLPFCAKEIDLLWAHQDECYFTVILMLIYSGARISELLNLKKENVNLAQQWFDITSSKTEAGIRRVPIARKVLPFFQYWMEKNDCEYLVSTPEGRHFTYTNYYFYYWKPLMERLNMDSHRPHDTRHTCVTLLTSKGVDEKIIQRIVGHKGHSITDTVYTHFELCQLRDAINKI